MSRNHKTQPISVETAKNLHEVFQFLSFLRTIGDNTRLCDVSQSLLDKTHKNIYVKLGQPSNIKLPDLSPEGYPMELGTAGVKTFIKFDILGVYYTAELGCMAKDVIADVERLLKEQNL